MRYITLIISFLLVCSFLQSQEQPAIWTLRNSIDYALDNSLQIKRSKLSLQLQEETQKQAKASVFPTLSASASETFNNRQMQMASGKYEYQQSFSENFSINSNLTLFNGFRITNNIKQQDLYLQTSELAIKEAENNMEIAITEAYLQILYSQESVKTAELAVEYSKAQLDRGQLLYKAGSIAESDFAQLQSQHENDKYSLILKENGLASQILSFKQLLELNIDDEVNLHYPDISDDNIINILPTKKEVYETALSTMPQIESGKASIKIAEYDLKKSRGGLWPTLSMNAGISTGHNNKDNGSFGKQLDHNFAQSIGISLGFNILNGRETRTNIAKSKISIEDTKLAVNQTEKDLLKTVESIYLDVLSSQNRFYAAKEALNAAQKSYELTEKKFNLGMKNTVEFLNEKNNFLNAQQEYLQAKYATILNQKLLDFYQNKPIDL